MTPSEFAQLRDLLIGLTGQVARLEGRMRGVQERLDGIEKELASFQDMVAKHFKEVYRRLDAMEARQSAMEARQGAMEERLSNVEVSLEKMRHDNKVLGETFQDTNRRIDALHTEMNQRFEEQRASTEAGFRDWGERVTRIEKRLAA